MQVLHAMQLHVFHTKQPRLCAHLEFSRDDSIPGNFTSYFSIAARQTMLILLPSKKVLSELLLLKSFYRVAGFDNNIRYTENCQCHCETQNEDSDLTHIPTSFISILHGSVLLLRSSAVRYRCTAVWWLHCCAAAAFAPTQYQNRLRYRFPLRTTCGSYGC